MPTAKELEAGFDNASNLEQGSSPVDSNRNGATTPPLSPGTVSGSTLAAGTTRSSISAIKRVVSDVIKPIKPNIQSSKAPFKTRKLEDYPLGYPRVSYLLDSDDSFMMYRRFGQLHSRILLHKQDQLRELEHELLERDQLDDKDEETQLYLKCREDADYAPNPSKGRSRILILQDSEKLLREYGSLLQQANQLQGMSRVTDRDHASVSHYFKNEEPVMENDRDFLLHKEDLVTIRAGRDHAWLDSVVESVLRWYPCGPFRYLFCDQATRDKTSDPAIHYFTRSRINFFVTLIITFLILILLVVPIWVLFWLSVNEKNSAGDVLVIGVLLICTLVFSCTLSLFTKAKRHELLAASAGYCAVLVVFVGNVGNTQGS